MHQKHLSDQWRICKFQIGSVLQKLSPGGSLIWADTNSITAFRVEVGNDNNPVICGFPNSGTPGAAFIKYSSAGNVLWQNLDADGPGYALLLHAQMRMDIDNAAYLRLAHYHKWHCAKLIVTEFLNGLLLFQVAIPMRLISRPKM
ncbi:MAG: hypothetical protein IPP38_14310 [Bacteroidetes bacterium]|nr:hypothetical protein [Bacteroidota bacterium]